MLKTSILTKKRVDINYSLGTAFPGLPLKQACSEYTFRKVIKMPKNKNGARFKSKFKPRAIFEYRRKVKRGHFRDEVPTPEKHRRMRRIAKCHPHRDQRIS